jgi:ssRNA-specific RNase YbeY (16S rRNA maturation enzyme)
MQENLKGILLLIVLVALSFFGFRIFNNTDNRESLSETETDTISTSTTTTTLYIETYNLPSFDFEIDVENALQSINELCLVKNTWFSLTNECLNNWLYSYKLITANEKLYLSHYEYTFDYFMNNYSNIEKNDVEFIIKSLAIKEQMKFYTSEIIEIEKVLAIKNNQEENTTTIFLSDDAINNSKDIGTNDLLNGCYVDSADNPDDESMLIEVESENSRNSEALNYGIKIESNINIDSDCISKLLNIVLNHENGWTKITGKSFNHTNIENSDYVYIFASPETTDELCFPLETNGIYSCRNESEIVINNFRWRNGASDFLNDMETYRLYLINHETGHILGWGHRGCPKEGAIAPLMMQQSKGTDGCIPYGWPVYEMIKANFDN